MKNIFQKLWTPGGCFLLAFFLLLICSRSSFLYPCNDWNDANSYFTMGKALVNGQIIYRDLYDQKGPYLYLIYGIAYLLSNDSFKGVFVIEVLGIGLFFFSAFKILTLYCKKQTAWLMLPVLGMAILASKSFYWGGAAEEFCLPLFGFSLYFSLKYFKEQYPRPMDIRLLFINGIFAGIIMLIKYTILGFYIAFMGMVVLSYILQKDWQEMLKACLVFLGGMLMPAIPWLIFFGANGALDDWYICYIYNNIFLYSNLNEGESSIGTRIYALAKILYWLILDNWGYFLFIILGVAVIIISRQNRWYEKLNILALCGLTFVGIYVGGSDLPYYSIPLTCFAVLGFTFIGKGIDKACAGLLTRKWVCRVLLLCITAGSMAGAYTCSMNTPFMRQDKESYYLYQFKHIVEKEPEPTLLNISCLDVGLYTLADIMPTCKYFQTNGISLEEMFREQELYIAEGRTQFVLARDEYPKEIWDNYGLSAQRSYEWNGQNYIYYLFKRKS